MKTSLMYLACSPEDAPLVVVTTTSDGISQARNPSILWFGSSFTISNTISASGPLTTPSAIRFTRTVGNFTWTSPWTRTGIKKSTSKLGIVRKAFRCTDMTNTGLIFKAYSCKGLPGRLSGDYTVLLPGRFFTSGSFPLPSDGTSGQASPSGKRECARRFRRCAPHRYGTPGGRAGQSPPPGGFLRRCQGAAAPGSAYPP